MIMPPWYEVPPAGYGGLERVCASLIDGLIARGHDVTLFGTGTRTGTGARFVSTNPELQYPRLLRVDAGAGPRDPGQRDARTGALRHRARPHHGRTGHRVAAQRAVGGDRARLPDRRAATTICRKWTTSVSLIAISHAQRRVAPDLNWTATIHHGIEVRRPGQDGAGRRTGAVAGPVRPGEGPGPRHRGVPQGRTCRWCSPASATSRTSGATSTRSSGRCSAPTSSWCSTPTGTAPTPCCCEARSLLMSIRWEEPFGMVMIEAMAKGTPVVALRRGSVPEVVLHGRTGVVCVGRVRAARRRCTRRGTLDPADCVAHVRTSFSVELMAHRYERVYRRLIGAQRRSTRRWPPQPDPARTDRLRGSGRRLARAAGAGAAASAARPPSAPSRLDRGRAALGRR